MILNIQNLRENIYLIYFYFFKLLEGEFFIAIQILEFSGFLFSPFSFFQEIKFMIIEEKNIYNIQV